MWCFFLARRCLKILSIYTASAVKHLIGLKYSVLNLCKWVWTISTSIFISARPWESQHCARYGVCQILATERIVWLLHSAISVLTHTAYSSRLHVFFIHWHTARFFLPLHLNKFKLKNLHNLAFLWIVTWDKWSIGSLEYIHFLLCSMHLGNIIIKVCNYLPFQCFDVLGPV